MPFDDDLTGRARAALMMNLPIGGMATTPTFMPGGEIPGVPGGMLPMSMPGGTIEDTQPDFMASLPLIQANARAMAQQLGAQASPPPQPPPQDQGGLLQTLLRVALSAGQAGLSNDPGRALQGLIQANEEAERRRAELERVAQLDREKEQRELERVLTMSAINQDVQGRQQAAEDKRQSNREYERSRREASREDAILSRQDRKSADIAAREDSRIEAENARQDKAIKAQQQQQARTLSAQYRKLGAAKYAKELGEYDAGLIDKLSPGAEKWQSAQAKINEIRATRAASGGTGGSSAKEDDFLRQFEIAKQGIYAAENAGDRNGADIVRRNVGALMKKAPRNIEVGYDGQGNPYAKKKGVAGAQPPAAGGNYTADEQAYAQRFNLPLDQARQELQGR